MREGLLEYFNFKLFGKLQPLLLLLGAGLKDVGKLNERVQRRGFDAVEFGKLYAGMNCNFPTLGREQKLVIHSICIAT